MGDATCCLLTCEEMIAHHLITTIHNGAACEVKTIHLSYQATNFASVFFLQDRIETKTSGRWTGRAVQKL